jgi:hypothetical protein
LPKIVGDPPVELPDPVQEEGSFGKRPFFRDDLASDDVLTAFRLFRHTEIRSTGHASWSDTHWLSGGIEFRVLGHWPYGGRFELAEADVPAFLELWSLLVEGTECFSFSIHRFNLAFERRLLADRIVDLVIAGEALLLGDMNENYRGELRFRFALRAAKFIEHSSYSEHEVFVVMRRAYDVRSSIVHGGTPKNTRLPENPGADLTVFTNVIENLMRLGLRKALSMRVHGRNLRQAGYWDALLLSNLPRG